MSLPDDPAAYRRLLYFLAGGTGADTPRSRAYYADGPDLPTHQITWYGRQQPDHGVIEVRVYDGVMLRTVLAFWAKDVAREGFRRGHQFDWLDLARQIVKPLRVQFAAEFEAERVAARRARVSS